MKVFYSVGLHLERHLRTGPLEKVDLGYSMGLMKRCSIPHWTWRGRPRSYSYNAGCFSFSSQDTKCMTLMKLKNLKAEGHHLSKLLEERG